MIDGQFAVLDTTDHLGQVAIPSLKRVLDQRSGLSWYRAVGYE